jgi:hypothetical protein
MELLAISARSTGSGSPGPASAYATPGMDPQAATLDRRVREENTIAPSAAVPHITPNRATPSHDLLPIKTPFIPDVWETMLNKITPFNPFPDVPISLRFGFDMGVRAPPLHTFTPPNHNSALSFPNHVISHIRNELSLGRYSGPFSRSRLEILIGPFRTSPLGTVPKSLDSSERRVVQDLSFPGTIPLAHQSTVRLTSMILDATGVLLTTLDQLLSMHLLFLKQLP